MDMEKKNGQIHPVMKGNMFWERDREKEYLNGLMDQDTKENLRIMILMELGVIIILMGRNT